MSSDNEGMTLPTRVWVVGILAGIFICWIGYNTQEARNDQIKQAETTISVAKQTNACLSQVIVTLTDRSRLNAENERLAAVERQAIFTLLNKLSTIPTTATNEQRIALSNQYINEAFIGIGPATAQRAANAIERSKNTYPDPDCGVKLP